jgi:hypothetical protein
LPLQEHALLDGAAKRGEELLRCGFGHELTNSLAGKALRLQILRSDRAEGV